LIDSRDAITELTLMLAYLLSWEESSFKGLPPERRAWKGYDFDTLNLLEERGFISQSKRAKSLYFTEEGKARALELLAGYGIDVDEA
jgi:hypothetical protein